MRSKADFVVVKWFISRRKRPNREGQYGPPTPGWWV